jgi:NAD+ synthase (glutamine-hydrolysing)
MAQVAAAVGDVDGNVERILGAWHEAAGQGADLVVFTELTITGYPPEDLLLKPEFVAATQDAVDRLCAEGPAGTVAVVGTVATVGHLEPVDEEAWDVAIPALDLRNRALVLADGELVTHYDKWRLPNYGVFDEARYFVADDETVVFPVAGVPVGLTICEDLWTDRGPLAEAAVAGARVIVNLNASPYHRGKRADREAWVRHHATRDGTWVVYVNQVGGQDDVVFDGDSMLVSPDGAVVALGAQFATDLVVVDVPVAPVEGLTGPAGWMTDRPDLPPRQDAPRLDPHAEVWHALVLATRDYCRRNGFREAIIGLSGGIDSAVTAAVAADALGGENVIAVLMPSPYSSDHSLTDARELAANLGVRTHEVPIGPAMAALDEMIADMFAAEDRIHPGAGHVTLTQENIQSRIRGMVVMALSNETGAIVLTTGNKSEYAVGYATLYGDMAGGFAPLKDVPKTLVFELARWRNRDGVVIPENTITKPPSAELKPDQVDQDSLPPYEILDDIVAAYVEDHCGIAAIVARGHDETVVREVVRMIDRSEYKRRQAAPGPKVTARAFGKERRMPMTHGWRS